MTTISDYDMLRLEAPRDFLQITDGTAPVEEAVELLNPAVWVRSLVRQQQQAEEDLQRLAEACGDTIDRTDSRILRVERAYQTLADGTRYLYDRVTANEEIAEGWVRSELAVAANAYQTFAREIWQAIIDKTKEADQRQICQATQLARVNDALAFLGEANIARSQHLATFQGNVEIWAADHQRRVAALEKQLQEAIQGIATRIPIPPSPPRHQARPQPWRSPARPSSTSIADALQRLTTLPEAPRDPRRQRPPAIPRTPSPPHQRPPMFGGGIGGPPGPPRRPPAPPHRSPTPPGRSTSPQPPSLTPQQLVQLVSEGVARAQIYAPPRTERPLISRLKMTNPETFDGKTTTPFNTWWKSVTKYLSFYPETGDQQKIAWVGTLLTGTAKAWDIHRYDTLGENDTWVNYSAAIRAEYVDTREAANAQLKLSQLRYTGDIRAYLTEFRALNNYARATGEGLQEKVDLAMPDSVLDMRFAHYLGEFADDEGFLQATYQAALQVEKKKALKQAKEAMKATGATIGRGGSDNTGRQGNNPRAATRGQEKPEPRAEARREIRSRRKDEWESTAAALNGVPQNEIDAHKKNRDNCWRCGRKGHRTFDCFSFQTVQGTALAPAPWKAAAVHENPHTAGSAKKRGHDEEDPEPQPAKQQKVAAVEEMTTDIPLWADQDASENSDF